MPHDTSQKLKPYGHILILQLMQYAAYDLGNQDRDRTHLVFAIIASHADADGICWPSLTKIGKKLGVTRQAITHHVNILRKQKYLFVTYPRNNGNKKSTSLYRLNLKKLNEATASSLPCGEKQAIDVAAPASPRAYPKKTNKKPERRNHFLDWMNKKTQKKNGFFQEKEWEEKTGITKQDLDELETLQKIAFQGVNRSRRVQTDLSIQKAAKAYSSDPKERMAFLTEEYGKLVSQEPPNTPTP